MPSYFEIMFIEWVIKKLKQIWFYLTVTPNSPRGLRHRAERIAEKYGEDNAYASALRKQADLKEEQGD